MGIVFVNGEFLHAQDAKISIFDRGFLFGDAVYEVLPVYQGQPFFVDYHIKRLCSNLEKIKITIPACNWHELIEQLILKNQGGDLQIYIHITRGNQGMRKHDIPDSLEPTIVAFTMHHHFPTLLEKEKGLKAKTIEDTRWKRCDIKTTSLLANILLNDEAVSSGFNTSILVRNDLITEGSTSNIFIVTQNGTIKTPPLDNLCLPGITRQIAIDLIKKLNWPLKEEPIHVDELLNAKEVWLTSTTKEIFPITQVDDKLINNGTAGEYWHTVEPLYQGLIK